MTFFDFISSKNDVNVLSKSNIFFVGLLKVTEEKKPDPQVRGNKMSSDPEHCKLQCHKSTPQGVYSLDLWQMTDRNTRGKHRRGNLGLIVD